MELKLLSDQIVCNFFICVLIVPLWNWNVAPFAFALLASARSNRTFMELKFLDFWIGKGVASVLIVPLWNWNWIIKGCYNILRCSNRTFMELKCPTRPNNEMTQKVLIVPLWNWNLGVNHSSWRRLCSNRTFMELKCNNDYFYGVRWDTCIKK